jgi:hypothetical protein
MDLSTLNLQPGWIALDPEYAKVRAESLSVVAAYGFSRRFHGCDRITDSELAWLLGRASSIAKSIENRDEEPVTWLGRAVVGSTLVCWLGLVQHALQ